MARNAGSTPAMVDGALLTLLVILAIAKCFASPTIAASAEEVLGFGGAERRGGGSRSSSESADSEARHVDVSAAEQFRLKILANLDQQQQQLMQSAEQEAVGGRSTAAALPRHRGQPATRRRKLDNTATFPPAASVSIAPSHVDSSAWAADDASSTDTDAVIQLRSERGPLLTRDRQTSLVFGLKPADKDLRITSAHLSFHLADGVLPRREHRRPAIKVDLVHWEEDSDTYKTEPVDGTLEFLNNGRYGYDIEGDRVRGILERTGRLEMLVRCTNCLPDRRGHQAALAQPKLNAGGPASPLVIADVDLMLVGRRPRHRTASAAAADESAAVSETAFSAAGSCDSKCCLRKLEVDFDQLGDAYSWVVKPRQFTANYCAGSCSGSLLAGGNHRNRTAQAIVVDLMLQRQGKSLGSCCVASSKKFVQLIYKDRDGLYREDYGQLYTTTSCACS